jgi:hypothetical protein
MPQATEPLQYFFTIGDIGWIVALHQICGKTGISKEDSNEHDFVDASPHC